MKLAVLPFLFVCLGLTLLGQAHGQETNVGENIDMSGRGSVTRGYMELRDLGSFDRPYGIEGCVAYLDRYPVNSIKLAWVNGHQAMLEHDEANGWRVNLDSAKSWCRYGINNIRVDTWPNRGVRRIPGNE